MVSRIILVIGVVGYIYIGFWVNALYFSSGIYRNVDISVLDSSCIYSDPYI